MYGTICFQCNGRTITLTTRGAVAQNYYTALCSLPAREIRVGMKIREDNGKFAVVTFAGYSQDGGGWLDKDGTTLRPHFRITTAQCDHGTFETTLFRVAQTPGEQEWKREVALAYQATLGTNGKPRKVRKTTHAA
jgi:hypothetical protein